MSETIKVSPTRSELINVRSKSKLAKKGYSLLKKKQDVLTKEFLDLIGKYKETRKDIQSKVKSAYKSLSFDIAYTGINVSRSISYKTEKQFEIELFKKNIMGLKLPNIKAKRTIKFEDNTFGNSPLLSDAAKNFHDLFVHLIELTSIELTLFSLSDEIKKIRRRVNSLEHIQIPRLNNTEKHIVFVLDEQERDNFIRLKTIKNMLESEQSN